MQIFSPQVLGIHMQIFYLLLRISLSYKFIFPSYFFFVLAKYSQKQIK